MKNELINEIGDKNYLSILDALPLSARGIQCHIERKANISKGQATYLAAAFIHTAHTLGHITINATTAVIEKLNVVVEVEEYTPTVFDFDPH